MRIKDPRLTILSSTFDHIGGLNTLFNSLSIGAKMVIPLERDAEHVANLIDQNEINFCLRHLFS